MVGTFVRPSTDRLLGIYINDHRAVLAAEIALAKRCRSENESTPLGDILDALVPEFEQDAQTLDQVAGVLRVRPDPFKVTAALAGEILGRLKMNGQLIGYSPLSRVVEVETLLAGIEVKRLLWEALQATHRPELAQFDFVDLSQRAVDQREQLEPQHRLATQLALSASEHPGEVVTPDQAEQSR
jgi:hypothetical protein